MTKVISLEAYRTGRNARSIADRLVGLGHHADSVRKTVTAILLEKGSASMAELCATALRRLEAQRSEKEAQRSEKEAEKILQLPKRRLAKARASKERARIASVIRLVAGRDP